MTRDAEGMPRWVKVSGLVALLVVLAIVILLITGIGDHGPGRHTQSAGQDIQRP